MPNWCNNNVTLSHSDEKKISGLVEELNKERPSIFNHLYPMPEELSNTVSGHLTDSEEQAKLEAQMSSNLEKYGYSSWYDWCVHEWGTKWDAEVYSWDENDGSVTMQFDTAWSPPAALYDKLIEEGWSVTATYYEPGMGFVGEYIDGEDNYYEFTTATADTIDEFIPEHLDEEYGISDSMREQEEENEIDE